MALQKLDKKQVPQVAMLAVLSCGVLGYFAKQVLAPSHAAAHTATPAPSSKETTHEIAASSAPVSAAASPSTSAQAADQAPPPDTSMRDPFQQAVSSTATPALVLRPTALVKPLPAPRTPSISVPFVPPLPAPGTFGGFHPLSPAVSPLPSAAPVLPSSVPAVPTWTVTGVLTSGTDHIAILRSGSERRFVRQGEWLDGQLQVAHVGRDSVTLSQGPHLYSLTLGGGQHNGSVGGSATPGGRPASAFTAPQPTLVPKKAMTLPSAISARPAAHKPADPPVLASTPHFWSSISHPVQQSSLIKTLTTPRLALSTSASPNLIVSILHPIAKPVVKVAAFRAKSILRLPTPHGMLAVGTAAPDFTLSALNGHTMSLSQLRGRPVVLTFWASWVGACGTAVPALQRAASDGHAAFVGVGTWDSRPALLSFTRTHGLDARSVLCDDSVANLSVAVSLYKVPDVPACYVLDGDGRVAAVFVGFAPGTAEAVRAILATLEAS